MKKEDGSNHQNDEGNDDGSGDNQGDVQKSFTPEQLGEVISKTVASEMEDFKKQFFKDLGDNRNPQSNLDLQQQEDLLNQNQNEENQVNKTYSTEETAKILMKRQRTVNPIMGAVLNNLGE